MRKRAEHESELSMSQRELKPWERAKHEGERELSMRES